VVKTLTVIDGGGRGPPQGGGGGDRDSSDWRLQLTRNKQGGIIANTHNLALIFENDDALSGMFALDEFANRVVLKRDAPWSGGSRSEFTEVDGVELSAWLGVGAVFGGYEISAKSTLVIEVVEAVARRHKFHPVREYLVGLKWDGIERVPLLFSAHCGTADDEYHKRVALIFMLSAAARILRPGCKVDTMLVLEGAQGLGKTRVTQTLFGGDQWYVDAQRSPAERDFYQDLVGKWGVEIGEMTSFSKAEANKVKQTLSATADVYRPSYGRYSRTFPRQCVFVGTTNEKEWQRDHTGGRRFLPVAVAHVDVESIAQVRDQLWAEAVARLDRGEEWWTLPERALGEQDARYIEDAWEQVLLVWLSGLGHSESYSGLRLAHREMLGEVTEISMAELIIRALGIDRGRIDKMMQARVSAVLRRWGWDKYRTTKYGPQLWVWYAPQTWAPMRSPNASSSVLDD
jgi:putative DNA primase/helicase